MRLWSLHPHHLDTRALVACWREGLLAYHVLRGMTKGYKNHPQLLRFKTMKNPVEAMEYYLHSICDEADARGYRFDRSKLTEKPKTWIDDVDMKIPLTKWQLDYEVSHLHHKILFRSPKEIYRLEWNIGAHPLFTLIDGGIEDWERL